MKAKYNGNHNLLVVEKESQVQILVGEDGQVTSPLFWKVKFQIMHSFYNAVWPEQEGSVTER